MDFLILWAKGLAAVLFAISIVFSVLFAFEGSRWDLASIISAVYFLLSVSLVVAMFLSGRD